MVKLFKSIKDRFSEDSDEQMQAPPKPPSNSQPKKVESKAPGELEQKTASEFEQKLVQKEKKSAKPKVASQVVEEILSLPPIDENSFKQAHHASLPVMRAENPFHLSSGETLHTVGQLAQACATMSSEVFSHHVTDTRNDFSAWIADSVGDTNLAKRVRKASTPQQLRSILVGKTESPTKKETATQEQESPLEVDSPVPEPSAPKKTSSADSAHASSGQPAISPQKIDALRDNFSSLRSQINTEIDDSQQLLETQSHKLASLKSEIHAASKELSQKQDVLQEALKKLKQVQDELSDEIASVHELTSKTQDSIKQSQETRKTHHESKPAPTPVKKPTPKPTPLTDSSTENELKPKYSDLSVRSLIESTREAIRAGDWQEAKKGYTATREAFYDLSDVSDDVRKELYNLIHGLYADIHLRASE